jgi:predicted O-methyltransferase YrrM
MRSSTLRSPRTRRWLISLAVAGLLVAAAAPRAGWPLFGLALLGLTLVQSARLEAAVDDARRDLHALVQIRPLLDRLPLELGGWAAEPLLLHHVLQALIETRPGLVVECGSGSSTVLIARCLQSLGGGRLVSIDHDPAFAARTEDLLQLHGVTATTAVVRAPLEDRRTGDGRTFRWYGAGYEPLLTRPVDVLIVDGPPGGSNPRARYPALPLLAPFLSPKCVVLLDDGDRPAEREIARQWGRELNAAVTYIRGGRGGWLLRRRP